MPKLAKIPLNPSGRFSTKINGIINSYNNYYLKRINNIIIIIFKKKKQVEHLQQVQNKVMEHNKALLQS